MSDRDRLLRRRRLPAALVAHAAVACMTGLLLGYDLCIAGTILTPVQRTLHLCFPCANGTSDAALATCTCMEKQLAISAVSVGAMFGALTGGHAADVFGRRAALFASDILFAAGGLAMAMAMPHSAWLFFSGRAVVGLALGIGGSASSAYLAEIAPTAWRGRFLLANELAVCLGCLAAYFVAWLAGDARWRWSIGVTALIAVLQMLGLLVMHESPTWLASQGQAERASHAAGMIAGAAATSAPAHIVTASSSICSSSDSCEAIADEATPLPSRTAVTTWQALGAHRRPLLLAVGVAIAHAATAANTVLYYSREVLQLAGVSQPLLVSAAVGLTKTFGVAIAWALADRAGRRMLLLTGTAMMVMALVAMVVAFLDATRPTSGLAVAALLTFILGWDVSWAGLMLTLIAEVLPQRVRGVGTGLAYATFWALSFVTGQFLESAFAALGIAQTFGLVALLCLAVWLWTWCYVPETANRSLEQIARTCGRAETPAAPAAAATTATTDTVADGK